MTRAAAAVPRVKVLTLGRFEILVNGVPTRFGRKTPARPLMLLKYLAAHAGEVTDREAVRDLWPTSHGASATSLLAVNVHRLRQLLATPASLMYGDHRMAIDPRHVWCDALAFERWLEHAATVSNGNERTRRRQRALALYRGDFLAREEAASWLQHARDRFRSRFMRALAAHAQDLIDAARWEQARAWYERGLELDPRAEELCLGLMTCLAAMHQPVEAVAAYRRFEHSRGTGPAPAATTQTLYRQLLLMRPMANP